MIVLFFVLMTAFAISAGCVGVVMLFKMIASIKDKSVSYLKIFEQVGTFACCVFFMTGACFNMHTTSASMGNKALLVVALAIVAFTVIYLKSLYAKKKSWRS